ncbi:MAG: macro domain-containing protein [Planctomycetaceae bacterium]|nr:macro domain-containing protein [Planctomycetaceae bacterium]
MHNSIQLWLIHPQPDMCEAFRERFAGLPNAAIHQSRFEDLPPHDCFITAGNAFGIMTAGIDAAVVRYFGEEILNRVQQRIMEDYLGEQPVGTAFLIPTHHPAIPFLCHAPTMRVPGSIEGTDKVYSATWGALLAIHAHNLKVDQKIQTIAFPTFGTGFGGMSYNETARQMAAAYRHYRNPPHRLDWDWVIARQKAICYDGRNHVVRP